VSPSFRDKIKGDDFESFGPQSLWSVAGGGLVPGPWFLYPLLRFVRVGRFVTLGTIIWREHFS